MSLRPFSLLLGFWCLATAPLAAQEEPPPPQRATLTGRQFAAVVRIENAASIPDYRTPWNGARPASGTGTGFLIGPNQFLTNAHVVSNSSRLIIRGVDDGTPHLAKIDFIAHDCDLALLSLHDASAFTDVKPLTLKDELPLLDSEVIAVGYPVGGDRISVTRGIVSRIDFRGYAHSGADQHLAIQIDAAINPGNSGGPVLQNGKVIGVAFQGFSGAVAQNVGYIIPGPVVRRFLEDIKDGRYDHYADLAIGTFELENPALRAAVGLPDNGQGVLVTSVDSQGTCGGTLKRGDVLLEIDGKPIASDGFIEFEEERVNLNEIAERKFVGDKIKLKFWRDRQAHEAEVELKRLTSYLMAANQYEKRPEYLVYAGLVFQPLNRNLMEAFNFSNSRIRYIYNYYVEKELHYELPQPVILTQVLPDSINTHLEGMAGQLVSEINGVKITKMKDVVEALAKEEGDFVVIKLAGEGRPLVLERSRIPAAHNRINQQYGVREDSYIE